MNAKLPIVLTTASVAALMGATANAAPVGNPMIYTNTVIIDAPPGSTFLDGSGSGTGTGTFDSAGSLTLVSAVSTAIVYGTAVGTVSATSVYQGSLSSNTWTYSGTVTTQITGCTGAGVICSNATPGPPSTTTGNPTFTLDILAGGTWNTTSSLATATLSTTHVLTPIPVPAAAWLFGSALLGLVGVSRKRKV